MKQCALMDCECPDDTPTLGFTSECADFPKEIREQAKLMIEKHGFSSSDYLCEDCFWK